MGSSQGQAELSRPVLSLSGSLALGKSHHLSGPQSAHLHNEEVGQMVSDESLQTHDLHLVLSKLLSSSLFM